MEIDFVLAYVPDPEYYTFGEAWALAIMRDVDAAKELEMDFNG